MIINFFIGILVALGILTPSTPRIGNETWCTVDKKNGKIECNYKTKEECEAFRYVDEKCEPNPKSGEK